MNTTIVRRGRNNFFPVLIAIALALSAGGTAAQQAVQEPMPSRWVSVEKELKPLHDVPSAGGPLVLDRVYSTGPVGQEGGARLCLLVDGRVYDEIAVKLGRYAAGLEEEGYTVLVDRFAGGSAESIKAHLAALYGEPESLDGAELIGNLPYIIFEMNQQWYDSWPVEYDDFPCDLFYMDLNGTWLDTGGYNRDLTANNGKYDVVWGGTTAEIWVSRLRTDNLTDLGSSSDILNAYFDKVYAYRTGALVPAGRALDYNDDDWVAQVPDDQSNLQRVYGASNVVTVSDPESTTAEDYMVNQLTAPFELILTRSHGNPLAHGYNRNGRQNFDLVFKDDYEAILPPALFYDLCICSGADYTTNNYIAGIIAFNGSNAGLFAFSSSKTGGQMNGTWMYSGLSQGKTWGDSIIAGLNGQVTESKMRKWLYGQILVGDGSLKASPSLPAGGPATPLVSGPASPAINTQPTITWTTGGGGTGTFRYGWSAGEWVTQGPATSFTPAAPLPDGTHTLRVQERNSVGVWSRSGLFTVIVVEAESALTITVNPAMAEPGMELEIEVVARVPLGAAPALSVNGNAATLVSAKSSTYAFTYMVGETDPPGSAVIEATAMDSLGNPVSGTSSGVLIAPSLGAADAGRLLLLVAVTLLAGTALLRRRGQHNPA